jgi:cardiolipin synthase (CMP-forming)
LRQLPHLITLLRLLASPLLAWLLLQRRFRYALFLVLVAGVTDWLDGFTARKLGVGGGIGVILDPLADKTMLVTMFVLLSITGLIPRWMLALVVGRDLVIVFGASLLRMFRGVKRFLPSALGKISTFFQIVLAFLVLTNAAWPNRLLTLLATLALALSAVFTALSGLDYIRRGIDMTLGRYPVNVP